MPAESVAVEVLPGETLADHHYVHALGSIGIAQGATGDDRNAHSFEIGWGGIDELAPLRIAVIGVHQLEAVIQRALIWQGERRGGRLHSRNAPHTLQGLGVEAVDGSGGLGADRKST